MRARETLCGLFGGTFDPIHYGHLAPVRAVLQETALDGVCYMPAAQPPHRPVPHAAACHRLAMVRIALAEQITEQITEPITEQAGDEPFEVADLELKRRGPSYTFDTIQSLRRQHPRRRYALLVGLDAWLGFEKWHNWQALQQSVHIIVIARGGWQMPQPLPDWWQAARVASAAELHDSATGKILFIETPPLAISSSQVRERIKLGADVSQLLPRGVCDYINEHNLYGE